MKIRETFRFETMFSGEMHEKEPFHAISGVQDVSQSLLIQNLHAKLLRFR